MTGELADLESYSQLRMAFKQQLLHFIKIKIAGSNKKEEIFMNHMPAPFLSLITDDCVKNGKDYNNGGARYNTNYIQGVRLGTITDSLTALRKHLFEERNIDPVKLLNSLVNNLTNEEQIRHILLNKTPKYGNDDDYADEQLTDVFELFHDVVKGEISPRGADYRINLLPTTCHVYFGSVMHASPDGRLSGSLVSEGISPVQGADTNDPTAVLLSASKNHKKDRTIWIKELKDFSLKSP
ncbi:pyruvate formate lyase family protein [Natronoflexus pectinivorans]|uniref:Pyruvate formate lyase-like protein n=1 Tax=Natronoflexus pectinivorans TaxID=682526 RepID=A0A4V2RWX1_9BACT|nr:pyruvate formate lyase family protein [Natronoflexus pectinivorans]TCO10601.1 pyruvate formate lyase-like protein [Natronoflexus pectinivorans]